MLYIIRHGQTELNTRQVLQGRSDSPLNETGIEQARKAAKRLRGIDFSHVYTSPLKRAVQTAAIVVPGIRPVADERLIEMDYGPYEGADLSRLPPEILHFFSDFVHNPAPEGMEPRAFDPVLPEGDWVLLETMYPDGLFVLSRFPKAQIGSGGIEPVPAARVHFVMTDHPPQHQKMALAGTAQRRPAEEAVFSSALKLFGQRVESALKRAACSARST